MAVEYLDENATTLAAGSWKLADGVTGGSGFANGFTGVIQTPGNQVITGGLDQSSISGVEYLDILAPFAGFVGSASAGNLKCDADGTAYSESGHISRIRYWAAGGELHYEAAGGSALCHLLEVGGAGKCFIKSGAFTYIVVEGTGNLNVNQTVTFTDAGRVLLAGGVSFIDAHSSDLIGQLIATGGAHTLKRGGVASTGLLRVAGNASVTLDCGAKAWPKISVEGGYLKWMSAAAPGTTASAGANEADCEFKCGVVDFTQLTRAVSITARTYSSCTIRGANNPLLTLTNLKQGAGAVLG